MSQSPETFAGINEAELPDPLRASWELEDRNDTYWTLLYEVNGFPEAAVSETESGQIDAGLELCAGFPEEDYVVYPSNPRAGLEETMEVVGKLARCMWQLES